MKEQLEEIGSVQTLKDFKVKADSVVLVFDNFKLKILPDTYEEFKFIVGESYKKEYLEQVLFIDDKYRAEQFVISKASKHMYSIYDVKVLLTKKFNSISSDAIEAAISDLVKSDVLDDEKYALQYKEYFDTSYYGKYYIVNYLSTKHVSQEIINSLKFVQKNECEKAKKFFFFFKNKFVSNNISKQKKKIYDDLLKRGFGNDISSEILNSLKVDPEIEEKKLIKSYLKWKKKYSEKKDDGKNITDKIISHLVYEGYNYDDIEKIVLLDEQGGLKND